MKTLINIFYAFLGAILFLSINIFPLSYSAADTISFSLSLAAGKNNYHGTKDCKAEAKVSFDSLNMYVNVNVEDDNLVLNDDPIYSDHIEIWIAVPDAADQNIAYISAPDSSLWLVNGKANLNDFISEIKDPMVFSNSFDGEIHLSQLDSVYSYTKDDFTNIVAGLRNGISKKTYVLLGQTHLGILPEKSRVYVYDEELLSPIEKGMNCSKANIAGSFICKTSVSAKGYTASIKIPAKSMLFLSQKTLSNLKLLIDVLDADIQDPGISVLSISKNRKWGQVNTYVSINLDKQFRDPELTRQFPFFKMDDIVRPIYFNSDSGWIGIKRNSRMIENVAGGFTYFELPNLEHIEFSRERTAHRVDTLNGKFINIYTIPNDETAIGQKDIVLLSSGQTFCVNQYINSFTLPDGEFCILSGDYEFATGACMPIGMCGCNIDAYLVLYKNPQTEFNEFNMPEIEAKDTSIIAEWSGCDYNVSFNDSIILDDNNIGVPFDNVIHGDGIVDYGNPFDWSSIISLSPSKESLIMDLGKGIKVQADWSDSSTGIIYKRLTNKIFHDPGISKTKSKPVK